MKKQLKEIMSEININLDNEKERKFEIYKNELVEWNNKINLTAITDSQEIDIKHFIDSCTINKYIDTNVSVIDVGTGAGFPGIPIRILRDDVRLTLLDSLNKRVMFLEELCNKLNFDNVNCIHGRAEDIANDKKYRECFDVVTARAVANLTTLSEYCLPFAKINGLFICMKGIDVEEEVNSSKNAIKILGGRIEKIDELELPFSGDKRAIIIIRKIKETPKEYPRKAGLPSKKPII